MEEQLKLVLDAVRNATQQLSQQIFGHIDFKSWSLSDLWDKQILPFIQAVDWKNEKWIQLLLAFHVMLLVTVLLTRRFQNMQIVLFMFICTLLVVINSARIALTLIIRCQCLLCRKNKQMGK